MQRLVGSVGLGGRNRKPDVTAVQNALAAANVSPGRPDGICGRRTIQAIERFQQSFMRRPDGRVDVSGPTWRHLSQHHAASGSSAAHAAGAPASRSVPIPAARSAAVARAQSPARPAPSTPTIAASAPVPAAPISGQHPASYWTTRTPLPAPGTVNVGLISPSSPSQVARFGGKPSEHMSQEDSPITNAKLKAMITTESVGPFRVTGIRPAIISLQSVLAEVRRDLPDLLALLSSAGMENNRLMRHSTTKVSNHAWGSAIDLRVAGHLVPIGATYSLKGLDALVPYFNRAGWVWGGGFSSKAQKDPMHFEMGGALMAGVHP
jgi:peptidoglycan hydrolase-like protein with peptidoglycan-binding domain